MSYTIDELATALGGIVSSLNGIAEELNHCNLDAEIDNTAGRKVICSLPIIVADRCVAPVQETFTVADLVETIEGLKDWIGDVQSKLGDYDPATLLDAGTWPPSDRGSNA